MPDSRMPPENEPRNWSDAFAMLPLEAPPHDAWARVAAEIRASSPSRAARNRRPWWTAAAATLALAIAVPLAWMPEKTQQSSQPRSPDAAQPNPEVSGVLENSDSGLQLPTDNPSIAKEAPAATGKVQTSPPAETRLAREKKPERMQPAPIASGRRDATLDTLYVQSAQLEALVAQTRDENVATGPAAVLADELESRVALIDASLAQSELATTQRAALWQQRVDALRQLAGLQSTQRLLAAQGERYDGQLVAVY
jgi:hypothetical protein